MCNIGNVETRTQIKQLVVVINSVDSWKVLSLAMSPPKETSTESQKTITGFETSNHKKVSFSIVTPDKTATKNNLSENNFVFLLSSVKDLGCFKVSVGKGNTIHQIVLEHNKRADGTLLPPGEKVWKLLAFVTGFESLHEALIFRDKWEDSNNTCRTARDKALEGSCLCSEASNGAKQTGRLRFVVDWQRVDYVDTEIKKCQLGTLKPAPKSGYPGLKRALSAEEYSDWGKTVMRIGMCQGMTYADIVRTRQGYVNWARKLNAPGDDLQWLVEFANYSHNNMLGKSDEKPSVELVDNHSMTAKGSATEPNLPVVRLNESTTSPVNCQENSFYSVGSKLCSEGNSMEREKSNEVVLDKDNLGLSLESENEQTTGVSSKDLKREDKSENNVSTHALLSKVPIFKNVTDSRRSLLQVRRRRGSYCCGKEF